MFNYKANRFYFLIAGYVLVFGMLAVFGAIEASRVRTKQDEDIKRHATIIGDKALYRLPRMELTLSAFQGETHHVRLGISLEMDKDKVDKFIGFQPRVSDRIITFLGHEDIDQINSPHGMYNLRNDILYEVNQVSGPIRVTDIIFRELVVR